ncbi:hypothetical protein GCM10009760_53230 [Kitasatospora kazusensis]|uniref:Uncharacterized protein n=1 Tax=Kitasatospora kazusensis TaxID=407974 RepID=A0ABP5LUQ4_9ACTN
MSQTTIAPAQPTVIKPQGTHHYVLTLQKPLPHGGGFMVNTCKGTCSPVGMTRHDVYERLVAEVVRQMPELDRASTLFFDIQPKQL